MMQLKFVGCGVSCCVPVIGHVDSVCAEKEYKCCCADAVSNPNSKNKRNNVSLLITLPKKIDMQEEEQEGEPGKLERVEKENGKEEQHDDTISPKLLQQYQNTINILIDSGKSFRDAYFSQLAPIPLQYVDVLLLTHGHADAMQGVEAVAELHEGTFRVNIKENRDTFPAPLKELLLHVQTFLTMRTLREVEFIAPALSRRSTVKYYHPQSGWAEEEALRVVGCESTLANAEEQAVLDLHVLPENEIVSIDSFMLLNKLEFLDLPETQGANCETNENTPDKHTNSEASADDVSDMDAPYGLFPFYSVPVEHGKNYISLGFVFGTGVQFSRTEGATTSAADHHPSNGSCVVYLSDISAISELSLSFLKSLIKIDVLVVDLLAESGSKSTTHFCWDEIIPFIHSLLNDHHNAPRKVYCVGMFCSLEYETSNVLWREELAAEKKKMQCKIQEEKDQLGELNKMKNFLNVESIELAYDGLSMDLPL